MARKANGSNQEIRFARGSITAQPTGFWIAALIRIDTTTDTAWQAVIGMFTSALAERRWLERTNGTKIQVGFLNTISQFRSLDSAFNLEDGDGWCIVYGDYAAGNARLSKCPLATGTWSHTTGAIASPGTVGDMGSDGIVQIGEFNASDDLNGAVEWWATGNRGGLTVQEVESLIAGPAAVFALNPEAFVRLNQATTGQLARDLTGGGANEDTGNSSMTVDTGSSPPWPELGRVIRVTRQPSGAGSQNVAVGFLAAGSQVFTPTIAVGSVSVTPALHTNSPTVFTPTLAPQPVAVTPSLHGPTSTVYTPNVGGVLVVEPGFLAAGSQVFAATAAPGAVTVGPALHTNSPTVFAPTLSPGAVAVTPARLESTVQIPPPVIEGGEVVETASHTPTVPTVPVVPTEGGK